MKKYLDDNGLIYLITKIKSWLSGKVSVEQGKGLSTNDLTNELKSDLQANTEARHIHSNQEVLDGISAERALSWDNKLDSAALPTVPTKLSQLENDNNFATEEYVDNKVSTVYKYKGSVATETDLPTENNVIGDTYNVEDTGINYAWNGEAWDPLGGTSDLSGYVKVKDLVAITNSEIDTICANEN